MKQIHVQTPTGHRWLLASLLILAAQAPGAPAAEDRLGVPSQPLISGVQPLGWSAGVHYSTVSRELKSAGDVLALGGHRLVAELGYEVAPFLQLAAQVGSVRADLEEQDGEYGLAWAAVARANLAQYVLSESPEVGRKQWLGAGLDVLYRFNESNRDEAELEWGETLVLPSVYYFRNLRGNALLKSYNATGYGLHSGIAFSFINGDYNTVDVEENRNFGFMLGADARWKSNWIARLRATFYGSGDQTIEFGTLFHF